MSVAPRRSLSSALAFVTALALTASVLGGVANAATSIRKFSFTMTPCVVAGSRTTMTATIKNDGTSTSNIGSIFLDSPQANFNNITPLSQFVVPTGWTARLESSRTNPDANELDGFYVLGSSTTTLAPGASIQVTFPVTIGTAAVGGTGLKTWTGYAWTSTTPGGGSSFTTTTFKVNVATACIGPADASKSTLTPTSSSITANGASTQTLTVTAKDANGNLIGTGGSTVTITKSSGSGTVGAVTDVGNGTYTASVTSPTATGSGVFVATLGGNPVKSGGASQTQASVSYNAGAADATQSTLTPISSSITADGSSQLLTVTAKDSNGNLIGTGGATVTITKSSGLGSVGAVSDNNDGTYTAIVTSPLTVGSGIFVATLGGNPVKSGGASQTQATVSYTAGAADASQSTLAPTSSSLTADGTSSQTLTVTAKDANGNLIGPGGSLVTITKSTGSGTISDVFDNGDGTYTATVTSPTAVGSGVFVATLDGNPVKSGNPSQTQATVTYVAGPAANIEFTQQPVDTLVNESIGGTGGVVVHVTDINGNDITTGSVAMDFGADLTGGVAKLSCANCPPNTTSLPLNGQGRAAFTLSIDTTSSGYQLNATIALISKVSGDNPGDTFAITNTDNTCGIGNSPPCTATFPGVNGGTVSAPPGTTLIIENNDAIDCGTSFDAPLGETVTIIPDPNGVADPLIRFVDPYPGPQNQPPFNLSFPVCKSQENGPPIILDYVNNPEQRCDVKAPPCFENQYFQTGNLDLVTEIRITPTDPITKR